jgi:predicted MFS family arabinose efflux permease
MQPSPANSSPPDPIAAPKPAMPRILERFGYRAVMVLNTLLMGVQILFFAHIGKGTPVWLFVSEVFFFGVFTSLQYTSMNTRVYADVSDEQASSAISIASTVQQMAVSFGAASASRRVLAQFWHRWDRIH